MTHNWPWPFITECRVAGGSCASNAESESAPCATRRAPARTTTDRSSRATHASPGRGETRPPANPRSVAVTTAARASIRPLLAAADTPPASRPAGAQLERVPRPSDGDDRSADQSAGSATPSPTAERSLAAHVLTTVPPQHLPIDATRSKGPDALTP